MPRTKLAPGLKKLSLTIRLNKAQREVLATLNTKPQKAMDLALEIIKENWDLFENLIKIKKEEKDHE
jgi:hypothetical protein